MFFASKLFTFIVISPLFLILIGVSGVYWYKHPRRAFPLLILPLVLLFMLGSQPVRNFLLAPLENKYSLNYTQLHTANAYIVLGGGIINRPPAATPYERLPLGSLKRCLATAYWYKRYPHPVIVCGGAPLRKGETEAQLLQNALIELGVPKNKIYRDDYSRNTYENIANAKTIMRQRHWQKAMLVTSAFHMSRGMQEAKRLGLVASALPCDYRISKNPTLSLEDVFPDYKVLMDTNTALKEYIGCIYYSIRY